MNHLLLDHTCIYQLEPFKRKHSIHACWPTGESTSRSRKSQKGLDYYFLRRNSNCCALGKACSEKNISTTYNHYICTALHAKRENHPSSPNSAPRNRRGGKRRALRARTVHRHACLSLKPPVPCTEILTVRRDEGNPRSDKKNKQNTRHLYV